MKISSYLAFALCGFQLPAIAADSIIQYCEKPNVESIILREPAQTYEFRSWLHGRAIVSKGTFSYINKYRDMIQFEGEPLENFGSGERDAKSQTITFQLQQYGTGDTRIVVFSEDQCPRWPGR